MRALRAGLLALALVASASLSADAAADAVSVSVAQTTVAVGGTLHARVSPGGITDDYTFHEARLFVMRPGLSCPVGDAYPDTGETVGTGGYGPFRRDEAPADVAIDIAPDSPTGATTLCSQVWPLVLGLPGETLPGPANPVRIVAAAGGKPPSGPDPARPPAGAPVRCSVGPHRLRHGTGTIRIRCTPLRSGHLRLRWRCVPRHGAVVQTQRLVSLHDGALSVRLPNLRPGRCTATVHHGAKLVGTATVAVR